MTAGTPSPGPTPSVKRAAKRPRPSSPAGPQPPIPRNLGMVSKGRAEALPLVVSRGRQGENHRAPTAKFCGGKRRNSGMREPVPFGQRRGIWSL